MHWIPLVLVGAVPIVEVPEAPPWPPELSEPTQNADGSVALPKDVADHVLMRLMYLDEFPGTCRALVGAQHELTASIATTKCRDQIAAALTQARAEALAQPPHDFATKLALVLSGVAGGVVTGVVATMLFLR